MNIRWRLFESIWIVVYLNRLPGMIVFWPATSTSDAQTQISGFSDGFASTRWKDVQLITHPTNYDKRCILTLTFTFKMYFHFHSNKWLLRWFRLYQVKICPTDHSNHSIQLPLPGEKMSNWSLTQLITTKDVFWLSLSLSRCIFTFTFTQISGSSDGFASTRWKYVQLITHPTNNDKRCIFPFPRRWFLHLDYLFRVWVCWI